MDNDATSVAAIPTIIFAATGELDNGIRE